VGRRRAPCGGRTAHDGRRSGGRDAGVGQRSTHAPVAQWIQRWSPEPDPPERCGPRVGSRLEQVEFYALQGEPSPWVDISHQSSGVASG
jgi:hypothetical protein